MSDKPSKTFEIFIACIVVLISFVCMGLAFWMSQNRATIEFDAGKEMFKALNIAWQAGFGAFVVLLAHMRYKDTAGPKNEQ